MSKENNLTDFLTDVADAIREKKGTTEKINPQDFSEEIRKIGQAPEEEEEEGEPEYVESFTFVDGVNTEFVNQNTKIVGTLTYKRANMPTTWTPIYLPFEVPVKVLADQGFDVAYINGLRREDTNYDGELDDLTMEVIYLHCQRTVGENEINIDGTAKTLKANYPFFVCSIDNKKELNIELDNVKLYAAKDKSYECTTMTEKYDIIGNSSVITVKASDNLKTRYTMAASGWSKRTKDSSLKPFRFYLEVSSRDGSAPVISEVDSEG